MNKKGTYRTLLVWSLVFAGLGISSCATVISREVLREVDQGVRFEEILKDPEAYQGRVVLLGGEILKTENFPDKTQLIVIQWPLNSEKKPTTKDASKGRFIVSDSDFLDPAIYRRGRKVTIVGSVTGKELRRLDERELIYPVITKKELYLWPVEEDYAPEEPRVHFGIGIGF